MIQQIFVQTLVFAEFPVLTKVREKLNILLFIYVMHNCTLILSLFFFWKGGGAVEGELYWFKNVVNC